MLSGSPRVRAGLGLKPGLAKPVCWEPGRTCH